MPFSWSPSFFGKSCNHRLGTVKKENRELTGLRVGGDRICNSGETTSSTKDLVNRCLEINGDILLIHVFSDSFFSASSARNLECLKLFNNYKLQCEETAAFRGSTYGKSLAIQCLASRLVLSGGP